MTSVRANTVGPHIHGPAVLLAALVLVLAVITDGLLGFTFAALAVLLLAGNLGRAIHRARRIDRHP